MGYIEGGLTELIGINERVDTDEYSASIGVSISGGPLDGLISSVALYATEDGTGAVQKPAGKLIILDADPATAAGDASITAAEHITVLGEVIIAAEDWHSDANGAFVFKEVAIPFHSLSNLYFVFFNEGSSFNDAAGDDEQLEFNFWYHDSP